MLKKYGLSAAVVITAWTILVRVADSPALVPVPAIFAAFWEMLLDGTLLHNTRVSLVTVSYGLIIASIVGFVFGSLVVEVPRLRLVIWPIVDFMRPIAALTMFPALIVLLGIGIESKIVVIFWTAWPAVLLNTAQALEDADPAILEAGRLDGASEWILYKHLKIPLGMPLILTGLRIGLSGGFISLVSAEMLGSNAGLGWLVLTTAQTFRFAEMYATILTIGLVGLTMNVTLHKIQTYVRDNGTVPIVDALSFYNRWVPPT